MAWLITVGTLITLAGLALLIWCILQVMKARKAGLEEEALKARLQSIVAYNLAALGISGFGLIMVIIGIIL